MRFSLVFTLITLLCLQGCGFALRGSADLPTVMERTYLDMNDRFGDFARNLTRTLEANDITVVNDPTTATAILRVPEDRFIREAASFSGDALISEFRITYQVSFQLFDTDGAALSSSRTVRLFRDYSFDSQEVLASQREEVFLRDNLRDNMSVEVVRRLESLEIEG